MVLAAACAACALAFALAELPGGRVAFRSLPTLRLPQSCWARSWLGINCAACGLTRSIIHLAEGDFPTSWHSHRLGSLCALLIVLQIPYRAIALYRPDCATLNLRLQAMLWYALIVLVLGNWLVDVVAQTAVSV
jgi:hypothetical protein